MFNKVPQEDSLKKHKKDKKKHKKSKQKYQQQEQGTNMPSQLEGALHPNYNGPVPHELLSFLPQLGEQQMTGFGPNMMGQSTMMDPSMMMPPNAGAMVNGPMVPLGQPFTDQTIGQPFTGQAMNQPMMNHAMSQSFTGQPSFNPMDQVMNQPFTGQPSFNQMPQAISQPSFNQMPQAQPGNQMDLDAFLMNKQPMQPAFNNGQQGPIEQNSHVNLLPKEMLMQGGKKKKSGKSTKKMANDFFFLREDRQK